MKKIGTMLLCILLCMSFASCGQKGGPANDSVTNTDHITIEALAVDNSYIVEEGSPLKLLYVLYSLEAKEENLKIDSKYTNLKIGDTNTYESEHIPNVCDLLSSYVYTSYIQDVYVGTSLKVAATFKVPEADLAAGKIITLEDSQLPDEEILRLKTDDIKFYNNIEEMAQAVDAEGYAAELKKHEDADAETVEMVKSQINGYEWSFYVNNTSYKIKFYGDKFKLTTAFGGNEGTYSIKNGYIICTYPSNNYSVEIPYEMKDGKIDLDLIAAFDVMKG